MRLCIGAAATLLTTDYDAASALAQTPAGSASRASWFRHHRCAPFEYIEEADRQKGNQGRPQPGQRIVRVESPNGRYRYHRVNTGGYVRVYRNLSGGPARQGQEWGYDRNGLWVNRGLRAEFVVGTPNPQPGPNQPDGTRPPNWAVGQFRGRDEKRDATITLTIRQNGTVRHRTNYRGDRPTVDQNGKYRDGELRFDGSTLVLARRGNGLQTTERGGSHNRVTYQRID